MTQPPSCIPYQDTEYNDTYSIPSALAQVKEGARGSAFLQQSQYIKVRGNADGTMERRMEVPGIHGV